MRSQSCSLNLKAPKMEESKSNELARHPVLNFLTDARVVGGTSRRVSMV